MLLNNWILYTLIIKCKKNKNKKIKERKGLIQYHSWKWFWVKLESQIKLKK